jgi:hypothetical protein
MSPFSLYLMKCGRQRPFMNRSRRKYLFNFLVMLFAAGTLTILFGDARKPDRPIRGQSIEVIARKLTIPPGNADIPTSISLKLVEGWELTSKTRGFGALSAVFASGDVFTFMADNGALIRFTRQSTGRSWPGTISALPRGCNANGRKIERDTESLTADAKTGAMWIGFEFRNGFCRLATAEDGGSKFYAPTSMNDWPETGGPEAVVRLQSGGFLVFEERPLNSGPIADLLYFDRDPVDPAARATVMKYQPPTGYRPVDAAQLPDGRVLVLNRRFEIPFSFSARLSIIDQPTAAPGKIWRGPILARFDGDVLGENLEALSIDNDGENLTIWMASDDNFMNIQRTLLLRFIWPGAARMKPKAD